MRFKSFALALVLASVATPVYGQEVRGTVIGGETRQPLVGAMVVLLSAQDSVTVLSGTGGAFRIRAPRAGQYRIRVEHIGFENAFSAPFELTEGGSLELNVEAATKAIELAELVVTGARRNCEVRPTSGAVAVVWEEARKALAAAAWTAGRDVYRMVWTKYQREIAATGRKVTSEQRDVTQARTLQPFGSPDVGLLLERGFVQAQGSNSVFYGPDANVLLSNEFQDTHCFNVERRVVDGVSMMGLHFEPVRDRKLPEVAGVMWLEESGSRLRRVEFNYVNLSRELDVPDALGELTFRDLPNGTWLIEEWRIRTPVIGTQQSGFGNRTNLRVLRYNETGGLVNRVTNADGTVISEGNPGRKVSGIVADSSGAPASGLRVLVDGAPIDATTDATGAFQLPGLGDGIWTLVVNSPALERVGFGGVTLDVDIGRTDVQNARIALPSVTTVAERMCATRRESGNLYDGRKHDPKNSILVVRAFDQNGVPAIGGKLAIGWNRIIFEVARDRPEIGSSREERSATLDEQGTFVMCGIPAEGKALFQLQARNATRTSPVVTAQLWQEKEVFVVELRLTEPLLPRLPGGAPR
jgi:hypothetical protein